MIVNILLLIIGFFLLIKGADAFVDGASSTASNFNVSKILIGLTIVAFGTSAPEFAISISALANGSTDMVLGNVIGSCIINILLILGIASVIKPFKIKKNTIKKELPICMLISTLLIILLMDNKLGNGSINQITRSDGFVIILFFTIFIYYLFTLMKKKKNSKEDEKPKYKIFKSLIFVVLGLLGVIIGSELVVDSATKIAQMLSVSERIISLTIVAFGTSLPELVTAIVSSRKGEQDMLLGNIVGSNIFNICIVLGIPVTIFGTITQSSFTYIDLIFFFGSAFLLFLFSFTERIITRLEGFLLIGAFVAYYFLVIF